MKYHRHYNPKEWADKLYAKAGYPSELKDIDQRPLPKPICGYCNI